MAAGFGIRCPSCSWPDGPIRQVLPSRDVPATAAFVTGEVELSWRHSQGRGPPDRGGVARDGRRGPGPGSAGTACTSRKPLLPQTARGRAWQVLGQDPRVVRPLEARTDDRWCTASKPLERSALAWARTTYSQSLSRRASSRARVIPPPDLLSSDAHPDRSRCLAAPMRLGAWPAPGPAAGPAARPLAREHGGRGQVAGCETAAGSGARLTCSSCCRACRPAPPAMWNIRSSSDSCERGASVSIVPRASTMKWSPTM